MVLFIFGTMLTRAQIGRERGLNNRGWPLALLVALVLGALVYVLLGAFGDDELPEDPARAVRPGVAATPSSGRT